VLYRDIEIIRRDGRPCGGGVAAALRDRLATLPPQYVPADVAAGGDSVVVTWSARAAGQPGNAVRVICSSPAVRTRRTG
jgi:hypothetical protein